MPFSPDGRWGLTFDGADTALVWRLERGGPPMRRFKPFAGEPIVDALLTNTTLILQDHDGQIFVGSLERSGALPTPPSLGSAAYVIASDDGRLLARLHGDQLGVWDLASASFRLPPVTVRVAERAFGFTLDGRRIVAVDTAGVLHAWSLDVTAEHDSDALMVPLLAHGFSRVWLAPGAAHVVGLDADAIAIYHPNLDTRASRADPLPGVDLEATAAWASFARDGRRAALSGPEATWLVDLPRGRVEAILPEGPCRDVVGWAFAASGAVLASNFAPCVWSP